MGKKDPRVDAYISKAEEFAKPVLNHLRELIHKAVPDVEETMKWSFPHFDYKGIMCSMASFKNHCAFGFWKSSLLPDPDKILINDEAMGSLGKLTGLKDLPSNKILIAYIKAAAKLNDEGIKVEKKEKPAEKKELVIPGYFQSALSKNKKAKSTFDSFSYSNKKEYVEWVTEAKTEATRNKRLDTAIEWLSEGKIRNWKYMSKIKSAK